MTVDELKALIEEWAFSRLHTDDCSISWDKRRAAVAEGREAIELVDRLARDGDYPERSFGFEYEYEGKQYAFHIVAESREEAKGRAAALTHAQLVGELRQA